MLPSEQPSRTRRALCAVESTFGVDGRAPLSSHPHPQAANVRVFPGGFFRRSAKCRVTAINRDHVIGRMALAIIMFVETHGMMTEGNLTGFGFSWEEISRHKREALRIAKSHRPELFRSWADFGC